MVASRTSGCSGMVSQQNVQKASYPLKLINLRRAGKIHPAQCPCGVEIKLAYIDSHILIQATFFSHISITKSCECEVSGESLLENKFEIIFK